MRKSKEAVQMNDLRNDAPLYIKVHEKDNVAIIVNAGGLPEGTVFPCGLRLTEYIPQGHKVALADVAQGEAVVRYGEIIGCAVRPIPRGSWVSESFIELPTPPLLRELPLAAKCRRSSRRLKALRSRIPQSGR